MKNKNLFNKSMTLMIIPMILVTLIIGLVASQVIKNYFKKESLRVIKRELEVFEQVNRSKDPNDIRDMVNLPRLEKPDTRARSIIIVETRNGRFRVPGESDQFIEIAKESIKDNKKWPYFGETAIRNVTVFYAIVPIEDGAVPDKFRRMDYKELYYMTYISESYSKTLTTEVMTTFIVGLTVLIGLISMILFVVFKRVSKRLIHLEDGTRKIGGGDFTYEINTQPLDEIGRLGLAMNQMGRRLSMVQEEQAENFQMISHELKTPIMVINGYLDALKHNQHPTGSKEDTIRILENELNKLEKLTKDIIYLNKAEYLAKNKVTMTPLVLSGLFQDVMDRLNNREDIQMYLTGEYELSGDRESWLMVIENIVSNQLRYAKSRIVVTLSDTIVIENDGELIPENLIDNIMKPFIKGQTGRSGLGLTIVKHTLKLYDFELTIRNVETGVQYVLKQY